MGGKVNKTPAVSLRWIRHSEEGAGSTGLNDLFDKRSGKVEQSRLSHDEGAFSGSGGELSL